MSQINSVTCGLPICHNTQEKQTRLSTSFRVTAIALGIIAVTLGLLAVSGMPGLDHLGRHGWSIIAAGSALAFIGIAIECIKKNNIKETEFPLPSVTLQPDINRTISSTPIETFNFPHLPKEIKLEVLNQTDEKALNHLSSTNRENLNLIRDNFSKKILKVRFMEQAFLAWVKSTEMKREGYDFFLEGNTRDLLSDYSQQIIEVLTEDLAQIENEQDQDNQSLEHTIKALVIIAWSRPVDALKIINHAQKIALKNKQDHIICYCAQALSAVDPQAAVELLNQIERTFWKNQALPLVIKGLASKEYEKAFQLVNALENDLFKLEALVNLIKADAQQNETDLLEVLEKTLMVASSFKEMDRNNRILFSIGNAYISINHFDKAIEIIDRLPDDSTAKEDLIALLAQKTPENLEKLFVLSQKLTNKHKTMVSIANAFFRIDPKRTESILQDILTQQPDDKLNDHLLGKIVEVYISLNTDKAKEIAKQMVVPEVKIEALIAIAIAKLKSHDVLAASLLFDEAIFCLDQIIEKPRNHNATKDPQKIKSICYIVKHYALISIEKAETLILSATKEYNGGGYNKEAIIPFIAEAYAVIDFRKSISLIEETFGNEHSLKAKAFLAIAKAISTL